MTNKVEARDDLFQAINGEWLETAVIPNDKPSTGGFTSLRDDVEALLMKDVAAMASGELEMTTAEQVEFIKYYQLAMDFEQREQLAAEPLAPYFARIDQLQTMADFEALAPEWLLKNFNLPFTLGMSADMKNTDVYALYLGVPGTILPDTTYYQADNATGQALLEVFGEMSRNVLRLMAFDEARADELTVKAMAFDRLLVPHLKSSEELADYTAVYNPRTLEEVVAYSSEFSFADLFQTLIGQEIDKAIVMQPAFYEAFASIVTQENLDLLKAWLTVQLALGSTGYLSEDLRQAGSQFALAISGNPETQSKEKQAYYAAIGQYDQVVGDYYGKKYFGPKARQDVHEMVEKMIEVYQERLKNNDWLSQDTIDLAIKKLGTLDILVGYPDSYPTLYTQLRVDQTASFFDNVKAFAVLRNKDELAKWNQPVDHSEWGMSADTVNAYYNPSSNLICFPAAILQAPFYSFEQTRSENYGGIGAVIAHEISHAFDNNGSKFDEKGNLNNWWSEEDFRLFDEKAQAMIEQWEGIEYAGGQVNGTLTVSENIADGGGLAAALQALKEEDEVDIVAFFSNWARIWCTKSRQQYKELLLAIDVHSPAELRANIQPRNLDEFHEAFGTQVGDGMYLEPDARVVIW